ncbi:hypothetical protein OnM2_003021, partial [Erysiphe neolycopersici]
MSLRTVDDVLECLSIQKEQHGDISRSDAMRFVTRVCDGDDRVVQDTRRALDILVSYLVPCDVVLGCVQAISFFYPFANFTQAPWGFYCNLRSSKPEVFINRLREITMRDVLQDTKLQSGYRTVHMRGTVNGSLSNIDVQIYCGPVSPYASILSLPSSYEQSLLSACGGICFWSKLKNDDPERRRESDQELYDRQCETSREIFYAVSNNSTMFLGSTA